MRYLLIIFSLLGTVFSHAQSGLNLVGQLDIPALHGDKLNDVWGYEDELGNEYALVGARNGVSIVDVSDPTNPQEIYWKPGSNSVWRDLKVWGDKAYVTTEAMFGGLLIIDLDPLPASPPTDTWVLNSTPLSSWGSAHNLYIDEQGYMYIFGASGSGNPSDGVLIYDLSQSDTSLVYVGAFDQAYCHDGFVRNDTGYFAHISDGYFTVVDLTDRSNPVVLGQQNTPTNFTHNIWPSDDGTLVFTTDEQPGSFLTSYDITNLGFPQELDRIQAGERYDELPHNTFVKGDFLYTAYYTAGVTVHDISRPHNLVEVARYDTDTVHLNGYNGCWGVYPYFSSGLVAATDIDNGLYLFQGTPDRAAFLEGYVSDQSTGFPLPGVNVSIVGQTQDLTAASGFYANGVATSGNYQVRFYRFGYQVDTVLVDLFNDSVVQLDHELVPLTPWDLTITVKDHLGDPVVGGEVKFTGQYDTITASTNGVGEATVTLYYEGDYRVTAGQWGHVTKCIDLELLSVNTGLAMTLDSGYADDFELDLGWTVVNGAATGNWERGPTYEIGTAWIQTPDDDAPWDCGSLSYLTGVGRISNENDVDFGFTTLTSPKMDLRGYTDPHISYWRWYTCLYNVQDDTLKITLSDGSNDVLVDSAFHDGTAAQWEWVEIRVADYLTPDSAMKLKVTVTDIGDPNITEANFDGFRVTEGSVASLKEPEAVAQPLRIYPNPGSTGFSFTLPPGESASMSVHDATGKLVLSGEVSGDSPSVDATNLNEGLYLVRLVIDGQVQVFRWLKQY